MHTSAPWKLLCSLLALALLQACRENNTTDLTPRGQYEGGVLISNEGPFNTGTGTISYFDRQSRLILNDIFNTMNSRPLGNVVQSVHVHSGRAYIAVNNANKVEIVNAGDFRSVGVLNNVIQPRYFWAENNVGYLTAWGQGGINGKVYVIDLLGNRLIDSLSVGKGPERLLAVGRNLYVSHTGGFGQEDQLRVINLNTRAVSTINVGFGSSEMVTDLNGKVWVVCSGKKVYNADWTINLAESTAGSLVRINPATNTIEATLTFDQVAPSPSNLTINRAGNVLYYNYRGGTYAHEITATTLGTTPALRRSFYAMAIDPVEDILYAADAGNFSSNGKLLRYNLPLTSARDSVTTGIIPGGFYFYR